MLTARLLSNGCLPANAENGQMSTNERTNEPTNKHDGSQYLLVEDQGNNITEHNAYYTYDFILNI